MECLQCISVKVVNSLVYSCTERLGSTEHLLCTNIAGHTHTWLVYRLVISICYFVTCYLLEKALHQLFA